MAVDFSTFLNMTHSNKNIKPINMKKFRKEKREPVDFEVAANPITTVLVKETYFNPNDYIIKDTDLDLYCAALYGGPLF